MNIRSCVSILYVRSITVHGSHMCSHPYSLVQFECTHVHVYLRVVHISPTQRVAIKYANEQEHNFWCADIFSLARCTIINLSTVVYLRQHLRHLEGRWALSIAIDDKVPLIRHGYGRLGACQHVLCVC